MARLAVQVGGLNIIHHNGVCVMLVLSRKQNESIVIGGSKGFESRMKLTVIGIKGRTVKLGIEVANDVPVHRLEIWERINVGCLPTPATYGGEMIAMQ
jgi:carbon storage regulator CsrA